MGWNRHLMALLLAGAAGPAVAGGGPLGIDHRWNLDESGIWSPSYHRTLRIASAVTVVGGALWEGSDTRLGRTFWKSAESMVLAEVATEGLKRVTRRSRPRDGNNPDDWFTSGHHRSFPSGEVAHMTAVVTPFIAEYSRDRPAVWGLAALPAYVGISRMKSQAHWQTDVLAGAALGAVIGSYEATHRDSAWIVSVLPRGVTVGLKARF